MTNNLNKPLRTFGMLGLCLVLNACSEPASSPDQGTSAVETDQPVVKKIAKDDNAPPLTIQHAGHEMKLVRMMEGGVCKTEQQGAKGVFLLYANDDDIQRIKTAQGAAVFADFANNITAFSMQGLETAISQLDFTTAISNADEDTAQENLKSVFLPLFQQAIAEKAASFESTSTLKIAVRPFTTQLYFYTDGCEAADEPLES